MILPIILPIILPRRLKLSAAFDRVRLTTLQFATRQVHEEFWRGTLSEAVAEFKSRQPRGEITLCIEGSGGDDAGLIVNGVNRSTGEGLEAALKEMMDAGTSPSEASKRAAAELGAKKKEAYALALKLAGK
jgi:16S rRNA (cytidine1402-2'-O)-methyltransferase